MLSSYYKIEIAKIENRYPDDDIITSYKDYLSHKNYLHYYKFNPAVCLSLLRIAADEWGNKRTINKLSVLISIQKYIDLCTDKSSLDAEAGRLLTVLMKLALNYTSKSKKTRINMVGKITQAMRGIRFCEKDISFLIDNIKSDKYIRNLLLRYTFRSHSMTEWAKKNFHEDEFRLYRAEMISWIFDEDLEYEVEKKVLIDDFDYTNYLDLKAIQEFTNEVKAIKKLNETFVEVFPKPVLPFLSDYETEKTDYKLCIPELHLVKRNYPIPIIIENELGLMPLKSYYDYKHKMYYKKYVYIPDFEKLQSDFHENIDEYHSKTMIYAILFSRLDKDIKYDLIKKYYSRNLLQTFCYVAEQNKSVELFKWLMEKNDAGNSNSS